MQIVIKNLEKLIKRKKEPTRRGLMRMSRGGIKGGSEKSNPAAVHRHLLSGFIDFKFNLKCVIQV